MRSAQIAYSVEGDFSYFSSSSIEGEVPREELANERAINRFSSKLRANIFSQTYRIYRNFTVFRKHCSSISVMYVNQPTRLNHLIKREDNVPTFSGLYQT